SQQILDLHRQFAHTHAGRMVDARSDGGGYPSESDLADPARAKCIDLFVGEVEEMHVKLRHVCVNSHDVVGEVAVNRRAVLRIVSGVLEQCHTDSHHDRAFDLIAPGKRIDDAPRINHGHNAANTQPSDLRLPCYFDEMTAERVLRELRLFLPECCFAATAAGNKSDVGPPKQICERHTARRTLSFDKNLTTFEGQLVRLSLLEL